MTDTMELLPPVERPGETPSITPDSFKPTDDDAQADPDKFDWSTDDSVLLGEQFAVAVYRNRRHAIVIRQEGVGGDDDHFVILRDAEAARLLVGALLAEVQEGGGVSG